MHRPTSTRGAKHKHLKGRYTPHQGVQECERRVRQRAEGKCIHPRNYPHGERA